MVISLSAILVAPPIAAADEACPRAVVYDGCHLSVAVSTYTKDADGNFIPQYSFNPPEVGETIGDCFYVNAVVVNDGNGTADAPINATISFPLGGAQLAVGEGNASKIWPGTQGTDSLLPGRIADFWWKVCCNDDIGYTPIRVNVTADSQCDQIWPAVGSSAVIQEVTGPTRCVEVKIVEAPGLGPVTGRLINSDTGLHVVYDSGMPDTIQPCQNFGIKAEITNLCTDPKDIGNVYINNGTWINASLVGGDLNYWPVGVLGGNKTAVVAWTVHCDDQGDVHVGVTAPSVANIVTYIPDLDQDNDAAEVIVHQETPGGLVVHITQPAETFNWCTYTYDPIKQPATSSCLTQRLDVKATVTYTGAGQATDVRAQISASPSSGWVTLPASTDKKVGTGTLQSGVPVEVVFGNVTCLGTNPVVGNITIRGYSLQDPNPPAEDTDTVTISQQKVIAKVTPGLTPPDDVNICDPDGFDVSFRYYNWSGIDWANPNVTACIDWSGSPGNVTLGNVSWRKILSGQAAGEFIPLDLSPITTDNSNCEIMPETICKCCAFDVKWHFTCTSEERVYFQGNVSVNQASPAFTGSDTSEIVCVDQEWKAELWTDVAFFIQNDYKVMIEQDAMVPGNDFHVVIPVINTGDAGAEDVQVYFTITDEPTAPCTKSYEFVSASGDASISLSLPNQDGIRIGIASFDYIPGGSAEKAILLLHCLCEGQVSVVIPEHMQGVAGWPNGYPGMKANDANTGEPVPSAKVPGEQQDIHVPPCPMVFQQVPFTVEIENPFECQTFTTGDIFAVKALIHNGSVAQDFDDVYANLIVTDGAGAPINLTSGTVILVPSQTQLKYVGNITAGLDTEITWVLECSGPGEVYISVSASSTTPMLTAFSDIVNVHQIQPPEACLRVTILSPDEHQQGQDWDVGRKQAMIATGQQFAVTAKIANWGSAPADNVVVTLYPDGCYYDNGPEPSPGPTPDLTQGRYVTLAQGETGNRTYDTIGNGTFEIATFTLVGGGNSDWGLKDCNVRTAHICVNATTDTINNCREASDDEVEVSIYPAAFLKATIDSITPSTGIVLGNKFTVNYTVTNYGVADAWNASVTLSADSKVSLAAGPGGYTQPLGTVAGWGWGDFKSVEGSFQLQCTAAGLSTLTIAPSGDDECGWHALVGYDNSDGEAEPQYNWVQFAGLPIQSRFIIPASETIEQSLTGKCPDLTQVNITLNSGWNLISLPLIPTNSAIATVLSGVSSHVISVWYYDGTTPWLSWSPGVGGSLSTMDQKKAYWINMKTDSAQYTLTENGSVGLPPPGLPTTIDVAAGWNMTGFKSTCARTAGSYLSGVPWVRIWSFTNGAWSAVDSSDKMQAGLGYWIAATGAGTIYP
jgi:hypothetical protein